MSNDVISFRFVAAFLSTFALADMAGAFSGAGSGIESDPYIITNVVQLQEINENLSAWYALGDDIDASDTKNWNGGYGFVPIGDSSSLFTGNFDGQNHVLEGLYINNIDIYYCAGLFGYIGSGANISNVGLIAADISGYGAVGSIAASNYGSIINAYCTGNVSGSGGNGVGGLVGFNMGEINSSYFSGDINGGFNAGGVVGVNIEGDISRCYSTGTVNAINSLNATGGLVGAINSGGSITDSYSQSNVSGGSYVGGLIGSIAYWAGPITNCYSTGSVVASSGARHVGGLAGIYAHASVDHCYWDVQTSGQTTSPCGIGKTTAEMKQQATFVGWDFVDVWDIQEGVSYPFLRSVGEPPVPPEPPALFEKRLVIFENENEVQSDFRFNKDNLKFGNSNSDVRKLQVILKHEGFFPIGTACTGGYFQITRYSVASFQLDRGLAEHNGIVGDETAAELNKILDAKCTLTTSRASLVCEYVRQYCHTFLPDYFPPELVLAIAAQESGGVYFDNMYVAADCGKGIMQITPYRGSDIYFLKGGGTDCSDIDFVQCGPGLCDSHYKTTVGGIETNIRDALYALQEKYSFYAPRCPQDSLILEGLEFTCEDIQKIMTVWAYNGVDFGSRYLHLVADKLASPNLSTYFPGESYADADNLTQKLRLADNNKEEIWVYSPVLLSVIDPMGRVTGIVDAEIHGEIPASLYDSDSEAVIVLLSNNPLCYRVVGTQEGVYGLSVAGTKGGVPTLFQADEIPTSLCAIHEYFIDWDVLSAGGEGVLLEVDSDGDGIFENIVVADKDLTAGEFALQTETAIDFDPDTLKLGTDRVYVTMFIELPEVFDVADINVSSLALNTFDAEIAKALPFPIEIGDYDEDGVPDLMVKFDYQDVIEALEPGEQVIYLTGRLYDYTPLSGFDLIRVIP